MKKISCILLSLLILTALAAPAMAIGTDIDTAAPQQARQVMGQALLVLLGILAVLALASILCTVSNALHYRRVGETKGGSRNIIAVMLYVVTILVLVVTLLCLYRYDKVINESISGTAPTVTGTEPPSEPTEPSASVVPTEPETEPTTEPTEPPTEDPRLSFQPTVTDVSDPSNWGVTWEIISNNQIVSSYTRESPIFFDLDEPYFALPGIATFRGDNYRSGSTYGTATVTKGTISTAWSRSIGSFNGWTGCGWTGQPLVVRWDEETKAVMNLYEDKKQKDDLVEVIYATLDGNIYFYDLDDGTYTRDPIRVGMNFKGAGALDPRGYPLMYVGSGDYLDSGKAPRMFVISLIDGSILYERGYNESFSRRNWCAFDSSPLVDAESDTLIWPGENGLLFTIKLNTAYDMAAGTISVSPDEPVMTRYTTDGSKQGRWLGYEDSACIVDHYLYASENGGMFFCVDLNTMELIWAQDTKDDSNSSPVFEWDEEGNGYIYTAPSLHWGASGNQGTISIYKLNAATGEIVWEQPYKCGTVSGVSGGVQASPLLGKAGTTIEGLIIYSISRTPNLYDGVLVALDTETGEVVWELSLPYYAWSSPAAIYTENGTAYIIQFDSNGKGYLLDGKTGETLDTLSLGSNIEASPVVFENTIVVGTRGQTVYGIKIS